MASVRDGNKRKTVNLGWRPASTQSCFQEDSLVKDVKAEVANSPQLDDAGKSKDGNQVIYKCRASKSGVTTSNKEYSISVEVGASLMRFVKGKWGSMQKKIEEEMGVKIIFPRSRNEDSIVIEGNSSESVNGAAERVQSIIDWAVKSSAVDYSHFISLPLAIHPELVDKLVKFQNSILGNTDLKSDKNLDCDSSRDISDKDDKGQQFDKAPHVAMKLKSEDGNDHVKRDISSISLVSYSPKALKSSPLELKNSTVSDLGIDKSIFNNPKTFHLTVLMLKLWNQERIDAAAEVLQNLSVKVIDALDSRPVSVRLKGLECMKGTFAEARVLYAPVEEIGSEDRLLRACQVIINAFVEAGLVLERDAQRTLKLHATVMNTSHRKRETGTRNADSFDARDIVNQYGSEDWGEYLIREVHLSQRFAFDEDGYYHCCASIPFPANKPLES